jgi:hypothetical protein
MNVDILNRAWNMGRSIKVKYANYNMEWVNLPKPQDAGMELYTALKWDLDVYEYEVEGNQ